MREDGDAVGEAEQRNGERLGETVEEVRLLAESLPGEARRQLVADRVERQGRVAADQRSATAR